MHDVQNEIRAVDKLCEMGSHQNIVSVLQHGRLNNSASYFFDMELCDFNLETYAQTLWPQTTWEAMLKPDDKSIVDLNMRIKQIWKVMKEIACGVLFIHLQGEVHRDLKPGNSSSTD